MKYICNLDFTKFFNHSMPKINESETFADLLFVKINK